MDKESKKSETDPKKPVLIKQNFFKPVSFKAPKTNFKPAAIRITRHKG